MMKFKFSIFPESRETFFRLTYRLIEYKTFSVIITKSKEAQHHCSMVLRFCPYDCLFSLLDVD